MVHHAHHITSQLTTSRYVTSRHITSHHACPIMSYHVTSHLITSHKTIYKKACHIMHITSHLTTSCYIMSCHITSHHASCHIPSHHIMSHHISLHDIKQFNFTTQHATSCTSHLTLRYLTSRHIMHDTPYPIIQLSTPHHARHISSTSYQATSHYVMYNIFLTVSIRQITPHSSTTHFLMTPLSQAVKRVLPLELYLQKQMLI